MLSMIVARTQNGVIGDKNSLPFRLKDDMRHFVKTTMGKNVIMGRKTFESILKALGKPLPGRETYVLTRNKSFSYPQVHIFHEKSVLLKALEQEKTEAIVIGGAEIYRQFLPLVDRLYLTEVEANLEGDSVFPPIHFEEWEKISEQSFVKNEENEYHFKILEFVRKKA